MRLRELRCPRDGFAERGDRLGDAVRRLQREREVVPCADVTGLQRQCRAVGRVTIVLRLVGGFWANLDPQIENAARVLGANRRRTFFEVTLPLLKPALLAAALLVFIFDFTSFGVILILGGPQFNTLETAIYRQTQITFNLPLATALAVVQLACTFALMFVYARAGAQNRATVPLDLRPRHIVQRRPITRGEKTLVLSVVLGILFVLIAPLFALAMKSLVGESGFTLSHYVNLATNPRGSVLFVPPLTALGNSLFFALATMLIALIVGLLAAYSASRGSRLSKLLEPIWLLPLGASAVTLGFGFLIGFPLRSSWVLLPLAHSLVAFPFVVRTITPALCSIRSNLREAAGVMGANPWRVWREIDLPIIARALLIGGAFAFSVSLGEFGATAMISRADTPTLPYAIFRYLSQPGSANYGQRHGDEHLADDRRVDQFDRHRALPLRRRGRVLIDAWRGECYTFFR